MACCQIADSIKCINSKTKSIVIVKNRRHVCRTQRYCFKYESKRSNGGGGERRRGRSRIKSWKRSLRRLKWTVKSRTDGRSHNPPPPRGERYGDGETFAIHGGRGGRVIVSTREQSRRQVMIRERASTSDDVIANETFDHESRGCPTAVAAVSSRNGGRFFSTISRRQQWQMTNNNNTIRWRIAGDRNDKITT
jgi:hypothetical protein